MKSLTSGLLALSLLAVGCGKESEPGGPGATATPAPNGAPATNGKASGDTFTLTVPGTQVNVQQGENREVTLSIKRGDEFKQSVDVALATPPGVTATPEAATVTPEMRELKVRIAAQPTAPPGKADVRVTATPETGKAVEEAFAVDVKEAAAPGSTPPTPAPESPVPPPNP